MIELGLGTSRGDSSLPLLELEPTPQARLESARAQA